MNAFKTISLYFFFLSLIFVSNIIIIVCLTSWVTDVELNNIEVNPLPQEGEKEKDKIQSLPGQPKVEFNQYSGYVRLDLTGEKRLFYYFVESPNNYSVKPLVIWLNGGLGCSSIGGGAFTENGPFRVRRDMKNLYLNPYSWNNVANMLYLDSPAGVGFSLGNPLVIYNETGDISTAKDAYIFLINWLERFPEYKFREFYLTGESYAGHFVPQLAQVILLNNKNIINLKGIALGNAVVDDASTYKGIIDFMWSHAILSDETHTKIHQVCNFSNVEAPECYYYLVDIAGDEMGHLNHFNIYDPKFCNIHDKHKPYSESVDVFDECAFQWAYNYLNSSNVWKALHVDAKVEIFYDCNAFFKWHDAPTTALPILQMLIDRNIRIWMFSGDVDQRVPVTGTRYSINAMKLPIKTSWRPWVSLNKEVGGYVEEYEGLVFVTVRFAGHQVPLYQPERALTMFSSFLEGTLPPMS